MTTTKEKAAWTPGPWRIAPDTTQGNVYTLWDKNDNFPADTSPAAMDANARLIAKAPEMAERLLDLLERFKIVCPDVDGVTAEWDRQRIERIERLLKEVGATLR